MEQCKAPKKRSKTDAAEARGASGGESSWASLLSDADADCLRPQKGFLYRTTVWHECMFAYSLEVLSLDLKFNENVHTYIHMYYIHHTYMHTHTCMHIT
jgi:hypothetical protein